jgi:hypothetical protein
MGRGRVPSHPAIGAKEIHRFFEDKVFGVREHTCDAPPPYRSLKSLPAVRSTRSGMTVEDITKAVRLLPDKQCASDPLPTLLLKDNVDLLAPFLVVM